MFTRLLLTVARRLFRHWVKLADDDVKLEPRAQKLVRDVMMVAARERRRALACDILATTGGVVAGGPFQGLKLDSRVSWGDGSLIPKLLGCYEAEVMEALMELKGRAFDGAVNVGAAEGFYAVAAVRFLDAPLALAVDPDPAARAATERNAAANGIADKVTTRDRMDGDGLAAWAAAHPRALVISDCEGFEMELFSPAAMAALGQAVCVIECHDFDGQPVTGELTARFQASHDIRLIMEGARDPNRYPELRKLDSLERWLAVSEDRPETMSWIVATPKG